MVRRVPPITTKPADLRQTVPTELPTRKRYCLALTLRGMKAGDMPTAQGWDGELAKGREAW